MSLALVRAKVRRLSGRPLVGDGRIVEKLRAALPYSLTASQEFALGRDQCRSRRSRTHAAPAAGRCRLRQDGGRAARHGARRRGRRPGRIDGADRNPGAPAFRDDRAAGRTRRPARRHPDRPRKGPRAHRHAGRSRQRRDRHRRRHPCAVPGNGDVPRPRLRRRRRAASLRRPPAPRHHRQGRCARHAGDDRDADPAHAGADRLRRHGRVEAHRKAGRPPADPHRHPAARTARRTGRPHGRCRRRRPEDLLDLSAGRGIRRDQADVGRGPFCVAASRCSASGSASSMAA